MTANQLGIFRFCSSQNHCPSKGSHILSRWHQWTNKDYSVGKRRRMHQDADVLQPRLSRHPRCNLAAVPLREGRGASAGSVLIVKEIPKNYMQHASPLQERLVESRPGLILLSVICFVILIGNLLSNPIPLKSCKPKYSDLRALPLPFPSLPPLYILVHRSSPRPRATRNIRKLSRG